MQRKISIHVPREGHDTARMDDMAEAYEFQSTCPARGTTVGAMTASAFCIFQSTCPARGTTKIRNRLHRLAEFQSTCPARGTTAPELYADAP